MRRDSKSYETSKHRIAKNTVARWLREARLCGDRASLFWGEKDMVAGIFSRKVNTAVWTEYPVAINDDGKVVGIIPPWDELVEVRGSGKFTPPTYDELISWGLSPILIFDIAIIIEGAVEYTIEIIHTHDITEKKMRYIERAFRESYFRVWTIDADWVLCQPERPNKFEIRNITPHLETDQSPAAYQRICSEGRNMKLSTGTSSGVKEKEKMAR